MNVKINFFLSREYPLDFIILNYVEGTQSILSYYLGIKSRGTRLVTLWNTVSRCCRTYQLYLVDSRW